MFVLRFFNVLAAAIGFSYASQLAIFPLPIWPGTSAAGIGNRYFDQIPVPVAVPDAVPAASIYHDLNQGVYAALAKGGEVGGGHLQHAQHFEDQAKVGVKGYNINQNHDILRNGNYGKFRDAGQKTEQGSNEKQFHDEASHHKDHQESAKALKAAKFGEKKGHKRGHKTKGYHNKFHKDEYHKEHRFYDDLDKSGHHSKYGKFHSKYGNHEGGHKKGGNHKSGHDNKEFGKQGFSDKGHSEEEHLGHTKKGGHESYHKHLSDYAKDQGFTGGASHAYVQAKKD